MKKLLLVAAVVSLASVASADMLPVVTSNTGPNTPAGYESYIVSFVGQTAGEELSAFDIETVRAYEEELDEGPQHSGLSALVDVVARRPASPGAGTPP